LKIHSEVEVLHDFGCYFSMSPSHRCEAACHSDDP
jgi:hypothetical protein